MKLGHSKSLKYNVEKPTNYILKPTRIRGTQNKLIIRNCLKYAMKKLFVRLEVPLNIEAEYSEALSLFLCLFWLEVTLWNTERSCKIIFC